MHEWRMREFRREAIFFKPQWGTKGREKEYESRRGLDRSAGRILRRSQSFRDFLWFFAAVQICANVFGSWGLGGRSAGSWKRKFGHGLDFRIAMAERGICRRRLLGSSGRVAADFGAPSLPVFPRGATT
jgi:hypothetical protein